MGLAFNRWVVLSCVLALCAGAVGAQDGGSLLEMGETPISLVNPFTGASTTVTLLRIIYVVVGLLLLVAGWAAYRLALTAAGFVVGASFGASLTAANSATLVSLVVTVLFGALGAALASFVYLLAVGLVGGYIGLLLTGQIVTLMDFSVGQGGELAVYAVGAIVGAGLALALAVELTIILTSAIGAVMFAGGAGLITGRYGVLWTALLFAVGVLLQMGVARSRGGNAFQRRT